MRCSARSLFSATFARGPSIDVHRWISWCYQWRFNSISLKNFNLLHVVVLSDNIQIVYLRSVAIHRWFSGDKCIVVLHNFIPLIHTYNHTETHIPTIIMWSFEPKCQQMWSLWIILHFVDSFQWTSFTGIKYLQKLHKCIATPSLPQDFVVFCCCNIWDQISLIFKSSCHMNSSTFGRWEVQSTANILDTS